MAEVPATPRKRRATAATATSKATAANAVAKSKVRGAKRNRRRPVNPGRTWARRLERTRPGLVPFVLEELAELYGRPVWEQVHDPLSELVLTILSQNSADVNAEHGFESLRRHFPSTPADDGDGAATGAAKINRPGWGGAGLDATAPPNWAAIESAELTDVIDAIRPAGLAFQKAPTIKAALHAAREHDFNLDFLADMPALEARAWLTSIAGIGRKTASVVLLFAFGSPLMPVDRHVERVSKRIGLIPAKTTADDAHELFLAMLEPDQMYEAHVGLITHGRQTCHARNPACFRCPIAPRCRYVDRKAP
jgi:endonuclease-3